MPNIVFVSGEKRINTKRILCQYKIVELAITVSFSIWRTILPHGETMSFMHFQFLSLPVVMPKYLKNLNYNGTIASVHIIIYTDWEHTSTSTSPLLTALIHGIVLVYINSFKSGNISAVFESLKFYLMNACLACIGCSLDLGLNIGFRVFERSWAQLELHNTQEPILCHRIHWQSVFRPNWANRMLKNTTQFVVKSFFSCLRTNN